MTDWSSLKPLRFHSRFMAVIVLILAGILFLTPRHAFRTYGMFNSNASNSTSSKVKAESGLLIREQPTINSTILMTAPNNAMLTVIDENAAQDIIGGNRGSWYKVEYLGITGYAWGNYIDK